MKIHRVDPERIAFWCPGCGRAHTIYLGKGGWIFNPDNLTINPSIKVEGTQSLTDDEVSRIMNGEKIEPKALICHSVVTNGMIHFQGDCTHDLVGKTVEIPEWPV